MSELPSGGQGNSPEQSPNEPVREASTGFINRTRERLGCTFDSLYAIPTFILAMGSAAAVINHLSEGRVADAVISGVVGAALTVGFAEWAGRHERRLDVRSARLKEKLAIRAGEKVLRDGEESEA